VGISTWRTSKPLARRRRRSCPPPLPRVWRTLPGTWTWRPRGTSRDGSGGYGGTVSAGGDAGTRDAAASSSTRRGFYAEDCTLERLGEDGSYRALLLDNLFELAAFLEQRQAETAALGDLSLAVLQAGGRAAEVGTEGLASMLRAARGALDAWRGEELRRLLQLRTSPAAVERFARELEQARGHEAKWKQ